MEREKNIEKRLKTAVERLGGICIKHVSPASSGEPDRLIGLNDCLYLVETKVKGGALTPIQKVVHRRYADRGIKVWLVYDDVTLNNFIYAIRTA